MSSKRSWERKGTFGRTKTKNIVQTLVNNNILVLVTYHSNKMFTVEILCVSYIVMT